MLFAMFLVLLGDIDTATAQARFRSPFRYVIVSNSVDGPREITVLLDEKPFTETNLKVLFGLLKRRFPVPQALFIEVRVSLEDIDTPEEEDLGFASDGLGAKLPGRHPEALLARNGRGKEWISYCKSPSISEERVVIELKENP
jgi:hypothetical protein